jgi:alanine racemase
MIRKDGLTRLKSWVDISAARLGENLRAVQAVAGPAVETLAVVKANGYGHDGALCAGVLVSAGARWLGVSDVEEGMRVRGALGHGSTRILVMCGMDLGDATDMVVNGLTPVVWTSEHVGAMERAARAAGKRSGVHLEVDTGMARQGAALGSELARTLERLSASRWLFCEGLMTHLCAAEVAGGALTAQQRERFAEAVEQVLAAKRFGAKPMVRTGLAIYGHCLPVEEADGTTRMGALAPRLKPVMTWKTRIVGLREVEAGATVGYGATFAASGPMRLALLPVGYADGFRREASSGLGDGWVSIAGKRAAVVGRVSMNLTVVDVTAIAEAAVGGEVVLLGEGVSAEEHAAWSGTIPYDVLCGIRAKFELR